MEKLEKTYLLTHFLINFKNIKNDATFKNFVLLLKEMQQGNDFEKTLEIYSSFLTELKGNDFSKHIEVLCNNSQVIDKENLEEEKQIIKDVLSFDFYTIQTYLKDKFKNYAEIIEKIPHFKSSEINFEDKKEETEENIYSKHKAFIFDNDFEIKPIDVNENLKFSDLKGYKEQKKVLFENTLALLEGLKVNNILLYGDAGCGKSSSVRALLNEFKEIKIVQIFKNNLINLDKLYSKLANLPYKFIIFADDISFCDNDENISTMKAILEGSLIQCPKNSVIYATSNRRHLIKESFQSRIGDEIHLNDTLNEVGSLSERFGINLLFQKPTQDEFIEIVLGLAQDYNLATDENILIEKAKKYALIKGSRSPRIARQLIDNLVANITI